MNNNVCPKCKGFGFIIAKKITEGGYEYEFYKDCDCKKQPKVEHNNPFNEEKEKETDGVKDSTP